MIKQQFLSIALPTPLRRLFDYLPPESTNISILKPGVRVRVPFGKRTLVGVLMSVEKKSSVPYEKLKSALEVLDDESILPPDVFKICQWAAGYYHYSLGEVLAAAMPVLVRKGREVPEVTRHPRARPQSGRSHGDLVMDPPPSRRMTGDNERRMTDDKEPRVMDEGSLKITDKALHLNTHQQQAVDTIIAVKNKFETFLLDGVTGSGKTEVYLRVIDDVLYNADSVIARSPQGDEAIQTSYGSPRPLRGLAMTSEKQVLVLVPEISLTPQTIARFEKRFPVPIVALHSSLTDKQRFEGWLKARSGEARIVIGTRSAVFTAFANLGLIIIDEEHDQSFKQQDRFRYHARDLAIMRAQENNIPIVLGSATPSLETLLNARKHKFTYLPLPERAGNAAMPTYELIDLKTNKVEAGLSQRMLDAVHEQLNANNQVMLFLNRRGFSPVLYCTQCAWVAECRRCDARMVYHRKPLRLQCHHCDSKMPIPNTCQQCGEKSLQPVGLGTQRLEETLAKQFPDVPILRVDRDSTRKKGALHALLDEVHAHPKAILLGTQMLAKGHHFPNVTLVGIIDADAGLFSADFRAAEQMGQLLLQVAGRAGREEKPGKVMVQTNHPDHPLLQTLIHEGYQAFASQLLSEREQAVLPPYSYFAVLRAEAYKIKPVQEFLQQVKFNAGQLSNAVSLFGPIPAVLSKKKGLHSENLILKASKRSALQQVIQRIIAYLESDNKHHSVKWLVDIDPIEVG